MRWIFACALLCAGFNVWAAKDFSSWRKYSKGELIAETTALAPSTSGTIGLHITLSKKWHTYWTNPGDSGVPIRLSFKNSPGVKVKQVLMPIPERFMTGPLISFGYSNSVLFLIEVDVSSGVVPGSNIEFALDAEWLVCEDVCIPAFDSFALSVPVKNLTEVQPSPRFADFQKARAKVPMIEPNYPKWSSKENVVELGVGSIADYEFVEFFPFRNSGVTNAKPSVMSEEPLLLAFAKASAPRESDERVGALVLRHKKTNQVVARQFGDSGWKFEDESAGGKPKESIWWMLVSAFIGGLILNLMPCVFPILSIKLLSLLKLSAAKPREIRVQNFAYVAGVMLSFLAIAFLLAGFRSAGSLIGWGFQLQSPVFLSLLSWLFFVLSLNLLGVFEIDFLNAGLGGRLTKLQGLWGSFFTGVLAVVVASPCTAPFMGVALGFGLTQSTFVLIAVFATLGLGLAFPYLIFAIFPRAIRVLPKPGKWMNTVKQVMAFPLLLTTVWLLWILAQVRGPNAVLIVLAGCVAIGFAFWLPAWGKRAAKIAAFVIIALGIVYIYRSDRTVTPQVRSDMWQPYSEATLASLKGKAVFINMTADWCLTCKVNEHLVFDDAEVISLLKAKNVVLIKGDWTQRNEEITRFLSRYDRVGVPFYVLYSARHPNGQALPEVLTKSGFIELINKEFP